MLALFGVSMINAPGASSGWLWDTANALGLLTLGFTLYLFLFIGSGRHSRTHQLVSYGVIFAAFAHVLFLWLPDKTIWHYAALDMPHYMWAGYVAFAGLVATVMLALPGTRRYWHERYRHFRHWHYYLSIAIVIFSLWHILGSGFYFDELEAWLMVGVSILIGTIHRLGLTLATPNMGHLIGSLFIAALWVGIRLV